MRTADRIANLPPYLFAEIDRKKEAKQAQGIDVISLGIGDPDTPTPDHIVDVMAAGHPEPEEPSVSELLRRETLPRCSIPVDEEPLRRRCRPRHRRHSL